MPLARATEPVGVGNTGFTASHRNVATTIAV